MPPPSLVMLEMSFETSFIIGRAFTGRVEPAGIRGESWGHWNLDKAWGLILMGINWNGRGMDRPQRFGLSSDSSNGEQGPAVSNWEERSQQDHVEHQQ